MAGDLKSFAGIFKIVPRSIVASDMHINYERFIKKLGKPELFTLRDVQVMAGLTGIDFRALSDFMVTAIEESQKIKSDAQ